MGAVFVFSKNEKKCITDYKNIQEFKNGRINFCLTVSSWKKKVFSRILISPEGLKFWKNCVFVYRLRDRKLKCHFFP